MVQTVPMKRVVIVGDETVGYRIVKEIRDLGATGYNYHLVQGYGGGGERPRRGEPGNTKIEVICISESAHLAVFTGAPKRLLDSLSPMPPDIQAEKNLSWVQRKFSSSCPIATIDSWLTAAQNGDYGSGQATQQRNSFQFEGILQERRSGNGLR